MLQSTLTPVRSSRSRRKRGCPASYNPTHPCLQKNVYHLHTPISIKWTYMRMRMGMYPHRLTPWMPKVVDLSLTLDFSSSSTSIVRTRHRMHVSPSK